MILSPVKEGRWIRLRVTAFENVMAEMSEGVCRFVSLQSQGHSAAGTESLPVIRRSRNLTGFIKGIGIASAGRINVEEGSVFYATPNLPGWTGLHLRDIFQNKYNVPVVVDNDVNAAAIGEGWLGAARELDSYVCITLGTGVGGAWV